MNKTTKMLAVFLTAGLLLAGCAQKETTKSTSQSSTKATSKATSKSSAKEKTKESSTDESKKEDALAGAQKPFSKRVMKQVSQLLHCITREIPCYYKKKLMITTSQKCLVRTLLKP